MTESMEKLLKQTRLDSNLSIEDIAQELRIRKEHLKQFEKKIPDPLSVYELGYLRSYAKYLGLDVSDYIAHRKERDIAAAQAIKEAKKNQFLNVIKKPRSSIIITISACALVASILLLGVMSKKTPVSDTTQDQEQSTTIQQDFLVEQKGPYEYLITGIGSNSDINMVARAKTSFTILDPTTNKIISSGAIQSGQPLFIPRDHDGKAFTSLLIKTTTLNAFDIQQIAQTK
jgi:cytoskeletal protein RodZ